jgi:hypothetical protein
MADANHQGLILDQFTRQATVFSTAPAITDEDAPEGDRRRARARRGRHRSRRRLWRGIVVCAFAPHVRHATAST